MLEDLERIKDYTTEEPCLPTSVHSVIHVTAERMLATLNKTENHSRYK